MTASRPGSGSGWIYGKTTDLLIGCGLAYILTLPLLVAWAELGTGHWSRFLQIAFPIVFAMPHYGATLLRVYEDRSERRRYAFFSVYLTVALVGLLVAALHDLTLACVCFTVFVTWSPWHFAGQNYGLAVMFLRRREVVVAPEAKRWLYTSFVLSAALAFVALHAAGSTVDYGTRPTVVGATDGLRVLRLGIPAPLAQSLTIALGAACLGSFGMAMRMLRRAGAPRSALLPAMLLSLTQALWFAVPAVVDAVGGFYLDYLAFAPVWISVAHSCQYLWITSYHAKRDSQASGGPPYLMRCVLAGSLVYALPVLVLAPHRFGTLPYEAGLALLYFAILNIHHFLLDGAIWKLRDGRVARALLQGRSAADDVPAAAPRRWTRPLVWSAGALCLAILLVAEYESLFSVRVGFEHLARTRRAAANLDLVGRGSPKLHSLIARGLELQGDYEGATAEYQRSLEMTPSAQEWSDLAAASWGGLGRIREHQQEWSAALDAYGEALVQRPDDLGALVRRADIFFRLEHAAPETAAAATHRSAGLAELATAQRLAPDNAVIGHEVRKANERAARYAAQLDGQAAQGPRQGVR